MHRSAGGDPSLHRVTTPLRRSASRRVDLSIHPRRSRPSTHSNIWSREGQLTRSRSADDDSSLLQSSRKGQTHRQQLCNVRPASIRPYIDHQHLDTVSNWSNSPADAGRTGLLAGTRFVPTLSACLRKYLSFYSLSSTHTAPQLSIFDASLAHSRSSTPRSPALESYLHCRLASTHGRTRCSRGLDSYLHRVLSASSRISACLREYASPSTHNLSSTHTALQLSIRPYNVDSLGGRDYVPTSCSGVPVACPGSSTARTRYPVHRVARRTIIRPYSAMSAPRFMGSRRSNSLDPARRTTIRPYIDGRGWYGHVGAWALVRRSPGDDSSLLCVAASLPMRLYEDLHAMASTRLPLALSSSRSVGATWARTWHHPDSARS